MLCVASTRRSFRLIESYESLEGGRRLSACRSLVLHTNPESSTSLVTVVFLSTKTLASNIDMHIRFLDHHNLLVVLNQRLRSKLTARMLTTRRTSRRITFFLQPRSRRSRQRNDITIFHPTSGDLSRRIATHTTARYPSPNRTFECVQRTFWSSYSTFSTSAVDDVPSLNILPETASNSEEEDQETTRVSSETLDSKSLTKDPITIQREVLIDSLVRDLTRNVATIIHRIDNHRIGGSPSDGTSTTTARSNKRLSLLIDRWTDAVTYERQRRQRKIKLREQKSKGRLYGNLTVDDRWIEALRGLNGSLPGRFPTTQETLENISVVDQGGIPKESTENNVSPLFHFMMDTDGRIAIGSLPNIEEGTMEVDAVPISEEMSDVVENDRRIRPESLISEDELRDSLTDGVLQILTLFRTVRRDEWRLIAGQHRDDVEDVEDTVATLLSDFDENAEKEETSLDNDTLDENDVDYAQELFNFSRDNRCMLSSQECNLILAHILSDRKLSERQILARSLQLFNEMNKLRHTGLDSSGPDSTTYQLMFLALPGRLGAIGEAAKLCKSMINSNLTFSQETLLEAMKICKTYTDLDTASQVIARILNHKDERLHTSRPCSMYVDILMDKNMMKEALSFYEDTKERNVLPKDIEDELLVKLCSWPTKSRQGSKVDCTTVLLQVMNSLFDATRNGRKPKFHLWYVLLERLADLSRLDPSLEISINSTIRRMLDLYPRIRPNHNLMRIGLRSSAVTKDPDLIAQLLDRHVTTGNSGSTQRTQSESVPISIFGKSLKIAMQNNDYMSMVSIFENFRKVAQDSPTIARSECYALMVLGYTRTRRVAEAKELLLSMAEEGLGTSDMLFGEVLQGLLAQGNRDEAYAVLDEMKDGKTNLPRPGVSSYNAIIMSHIETRAWDKVTSTFREMKEEGIQPSAQSIQGYLLARLGKDGSSCVAGEIEDLLKDKMPMNEELFLFASRLLLPSLGGESVDAVRRNARDMGMNQPNFQVLCRKIVNTARSAEVSDQKERSARTSDSVNSTSIRGSLSNHPSWNNAVQSILELSRATKTAGK